MKDTRCPWNKSISCSGDGCPLKHDGYVELVERWALVDRTPPALDLSASGLGTGSHDIQERVMLSKCQVALFFDDESIILDWVERGGSQANVINKAICAELKTGLNSFMEMINLRTSKCSVLFKNACNAAKIPPTIREAAKWRVHKGQAYQYHRLQRSV